MGVEDEGSKVRRKKGADEGMTGGGLGAELLELEVCVCWGRVLTLACACGCTSDQVLDDPKQDGRRERAKDPPKGRVLKENLRPTGFVYLHVPPLLHIKDRETELGRPPAP